MRTIVEHHADHDVIRHELTAADRERASADIIDRLVPVYARGMHVADVCVLLEEQGRLECLPCSAVVAAMQAIVADELAERRAVTP